MEDIKEKNKQQNICDCNENHECKCQNKEKHKKQINIKKK